MGGAADTGRGAAAAGDLLAIPAGQKGATHGEVKRLSLFQSSSV